MAAHALPLPARAVLPFFKAITGGNQTPQLQRRRVLTVHAAAGSVEESLTRRMYRQVEERGAAEQQGARAAGSRQPAPGPGQRLRALPCQ